MNNLELEARFQEIENNSLTIFDVYEELAVLEKDYKLMPIAKIIKNVFEAYEIYCKHKDTLQKLINALSNMDFSNVVEAFDLSKLTEQIPQDYQKILAQVIASSQ